MRDKNYSTGLRGVLFEARHYKRMGAAIWLYGWLVLRQTHQQGSLGWVLGGAPISYREIEEETGFHPRTLERWMHILRQHGYVETECAPAGVIVRITKAKKFPQGVRKVAGGVRRVAEGVTQNSVANRSQFITNEYGADRISSSSIALLKDNPRSTFTESQNQNQPQQTPQTHQPAQSGKTENYSHPCKSSDHNRSTEADRENLPLPYQQKQFFAEARLRLQLLRAERDEAVRRELAVGGGPEVERP